MEKVNEFRVHKYLEGDSRDLFQANIPVLLC
jgi:hypothetical protein